MHGKWRKHTRTITSRCVRKTQPFSNSRNCDSPSVPKNAGDSSNPRTLKWSSLVWSTVLISLRTLSDFCLFNSSFESAYEGISSISRHYLLTIAICPFWIFQMLSSGNRTTKMGIGFEPRQMRSKTPRIGALPSATYQQTPASERIAKCVGVEIRSGDWSLSRQSIVGEARTTPYNFQHSRSQFDADFSHPSRSRIHFRFSC